MCIQVFRGACIKKHLLTRCTAVSGISLTRFMQQQHLISEQKKQQQYEGVYATIGMHQFAAGQSLNGGTAVAKD